MSGYCVPERHFLGECFVNGRYDRVSSVEIVNELSLTPYAVMTYLNILSNHSSGWNWERCRRSQNWRCLKRARRLSSHPWAAVGFRVSSCDSWWIEGGYLDWRASGRSIVRLHTLELRPPLRLLFTIIVIFPLWISDIGRVVLISPARPNPNLDCYPVDTESKTAGSCN